MKNKEKWAIQFAAQKDNGKLTYKRVYWTEAYLAGYNFAVERIMKELTMGSLITLRDKLLEGEREEEN